MEGVHPVVRGRREAAGGIAGDLVVPARPGEAGARHHRGVGVDGRDVGLVAKFAEQALLVERRRRDEFQRLIAVASEDDLVEDIGAARGVSHGNAVGRAHDARRGHARADAVAPRGGEAVNVVFGAAGDGPPLMLRAETEETVVVEKAQERRRGKLQHQLGWRAPHRRAHRHEVEIEEIRAVAAAADVVAEGFFLGRRVVEGGDGLRVEAVDRGEHPVEARAKEIFPLGEQVVERGAGELEAGVGVAHAE